MESSPGPLFFGVGGRFSPDVPAVKWRPSRPGQDRLPVPDLGQAVRQAVNQGVGFPPLSQALVPGDHLALALEEGIDPAGEYCQAVIQTLLELHVDPEALTVFLPSGTRRTQPAAADKVRIVQHDPDDAGRFAFLGASRKGLPLSIERGLLEADVLIRVGLTRQCPVAGRYGGMRAPFPAFSDTATRRHFEQAQLQDSGLALPGKLLAEIDEGCKLLGSVYTIQAIPANGSQLLGVLAGEVTAVLEQAAAQFAQAWSLQVEAPADLVIAAMDGGPNEQTWGVLARAVQSAAKLVADGGTLVLLSDLDDPPGRALKQLESEEPHPARSLGPYLGQSLAAVSLRDMLDRGRVFLLSRHSEDALSGTSLGRLSTVQDVDHLIKEHQSVMTLPSAQFQMPRLGGEQGT